MDIPDYLVSQVREGKVVAFLRAGASRSAQDRSGKPGPMGKELGELIADRFLGGKYRTSPLNQISEYAICESNLATVQEFIKMVVDPLQPSAAHLKLPDFVWHGLATTNYDRLVELAYE